MTNSDDKPTFDKSYFILNHSGNLKNELRIGHMVLLEASDIQARNITLKTTNTLGLIVGVRNWKYKTDVLILLSSGRKKWFDINSIRQRV